MIRMLPFPDIAPEIFKITLFGMEFALRWYALAYIVGIVLGWRLVVRAVNRENLWRNNTPVMRAVQVEDLLFWVILGVIIGGRLGYVLFYGLVRQPDYYLDNPLKKTLIEIYADICSLDLTNKTDRQIVPLLIDYMAEKSGRSEFFKVNDRRAIERMSDDEYESGIQELVRTKKTHLLNRE